MKIFTFGTTLLSLAIVAQATWMGEWWRAYTSDEEEVKGSSPAEIAGALTRLYQFFIKIAYVMEEEMRWPPHNSSVLDVDMCKSQGLGEDAIVLLQKKGGRLLVATSILSRLPLTSLMKPRSVRLESLITTAKMKTTSLLIHGCWS